MNIMRTDYVPGLSGCAASYGAPDPDTLIREADARCTREDDALVRALADALHATSEEIAAAHAATEKAEEATSQAEDELESMRAKLAEVEEANDAFRDSLRELHRLFCDVPEVHIFDTPEDAASSEHADALRNAVEVLSQFPSEAEKRAQEAHLKALKEAITRELETRLPGYAALDGAPARVEYKVPRGRKWHVAGRSGRMDHHAATKALNQVPEGSAVRIVAGY